MIDVVGTYHPAEGPGRPIEPQSRPEGPETQFETALPIPNTVSPVTDSTSNSLLERPTESPVSAFPPLDDTHVHTMGEFESPPPCCLAIGNDSFDSPTGVHGTVPETNGPLLKYRYTDPPPTVVDILNSLREDGELAPLIVTVIADCLCWRAVVTPSS